MDQPILKMPSDEFIRVLLAHVNDIVIGLNKDYTIFAWSQSATQFYQWPIEDVYGRNFLSLCQSYNYSCPLDLNYLQNPVNKEVILDSRNSTGNVCTISWYIFPIQDAHYTTTHFILLGRNLTLKKNNIAYHLDQVVACTPGSLYWKDRRSHYLGCNDFMVKAAGLNSTRDLIGKSDHELWPASADQIVKNDQQVIATGKTLFFEEILLLPSGRQCFVTGVKMPLRDENNNIIGIIGNALDITQLKKTEQELREAKEKAELASRAKTDFIRNMEHDIRTPFSGILGMANYLLEQEVVPEKKDLLHDIAESAKQLLDYCGDILDFSKTELGVLPLLDKKFDIKDTVNSVVDIEMPAAKLKKLKFIVELAADIPAVLIGDSYRLQRTLINLLSNAIKFTREGYVKLTVQVAKKLDKGVVIAFKVEDTGIGIPPEKQDFIYEKFSRLDPSNKNIYKGIGLGLHIVKQFVEEMEGEIDLQSIIGQGTIFTCFFPFKVPLLDR